MASVADLVVLTFSLTIISPVQNYMAVFVYY